MKSCRVGTYKVTLIIIQLQQAAVLPDAYAAATISRSMESLASNEYHSWCLCTLQYARSCMNPETHISLCTTHALFACIRPTRSQNRSSYRAHREDLFPNRYKRIELITSSGNHAAAWIALFIPRQIYRQMYHTPHGETEACE